MDEGRTVKQDDDGQRLDRWLKVQLPEAGFSQIQKWLRTGQIRVDGKRTKPDTRLQMGQSVRLPPQARMEPVKASKTGTVKPPKPSQGPMGGIRAWIIYQDDDLIAINKPAGIAVQGGSNIKMHIDGMLETLTAAGGVKPRLVHRLDKDTSGILLLARSAEAARRLMDIFANRRIEKTYWAITYGIPKPAAGTIRAPLRKGMAADELEKVMVDFDNGQGAETDYQTLSIMTDKTGETPGAALVAFAPHTGRMHQIRVHAAHIGTPLAGDIKYGAPRSPFPKHTGRLPLCLHAREITFHHPMTGLTLTLTAEPPKGFMGALAALSLVAPDAA